MQQIDINQAITEIYKLLASVEKGEEIIIARYGEPIAKLVPFDKRSAPRTPGSAKGKFTVPEDFFEPLPITDKHAFHAAKLPHHHKDPFDRMLIAQAQTESLILLSCDSFFELYDVDVRW